MPAVRNLQKKYCFLASMLSVSEYMWIFLNTEHSQIYVDSLYISFTEVCYDYQWFFGI